MSTSTPNAPATEPAPGNEMDRCFLLGRTALVVQAIMGVVVISSLVIKRQLERRKRPWRVWVLDVAKQLVGQAVIHALNLLISAACQTCATGANDSADTQISQLVASAGQQNPCSLYFLNILIDTTIGTAIIWISLKWYTALFVSHYGQEDFVTGHYGHPPRVQVWTKQLQPYLLAAVTMKLCVLIPITVPGISDLLIAFAHTILSVLSLDAQVIFVLAVFPTIMNVFQFCVVDQVIKAGKGTEQKTEHDSDYDLDDDEAMYRPLAVEEWANGPNGSGASPAGGTGVGPGGSGDNNGTPRLRGSAILNSRPSSRANSVTGSLPGSPRLAPEDAHLLGEYRKTGGLGLSGVERRDDEASVLFASSPVTSPTGAFATRRL